MFYVLASNTSEREYVYFAAKIHSKNVNPATIKNVSKSLQIKEDVMKWNEMKWISNADH